MTEGIAGSNTHVVTEQENDLAQAALADFNKSNYVGCAASLQKLEQSWKHDYKVAHNRAVAEFYRSDLKKTEQFIKNLNGLREQPAVQNDECVNLDDVEHCALYFNHAVVLFHQRRFNLSLKIVQKIFTFIEPMEESLAHKVCLLLLELLLLLRRVDEALGYIQYIMTQFASTKNIQGLEKEPTEKKPVNFDAATDAFRLKLLQYQVRCYLLQGVMPAAKRELKTILDTGGGETVQMAFLQANIEYLSKNFENALNFLHSAKSMNNLDPSLRIPVLFYNNLACIHYHQGKNQLAAFYFRRALTEVETMKKMFPKDVDRPLYTSHCFAYAEIMYNTGVTHLFAGNPLPAFDCLLQAVQVFHMNPRLWLRMAECCIMAHKKSNEEDFAIHVKRKDILKERIGSGYHRKFIITNKLVKNDSPSSNCEQSYAIPSASLEFASLCLKNALLLLPPNLQGERRDSCTTPPTTTQTSSPIGPNKTFSPQAPTSSESLRTSMFGAPSSLMSDSMVKRLRVSVLSASAYVSLCLGDYTLALEYANQLLKEPKDYLGGAHSMLGHLYAAETLLHLDRTAEALEHLQLEHIFGFDPQGASNADETDKQQAPKSDWFPSNVLTANIIMQYNIAAAHAIRGELNAAADMLKCLWLLKGKCDMPIQIIMLTLYLEIRLGVVENSGFIKQYCPHI